jgi:O-antigen ligase
MAVQQPTSDPQKPAFAAIPSPLLELLPDAGAFANNVKRSKFIGVLWALLLSLVCGGLFVLLDLDSAALPLVFIAIFVVPFLLWRYRKFSLYLIVPATILFEVLPNDVSEGLFDQVPFFWNVNTIFQRRGIGFEALPINLFELIFLVAGFGNMVRNVYMRTVKIQFGTLIWPLVIYTLMVILNTVRAFGENQDHTIVLQEIRSQFYLITMYLFAINITDPKVDVKRFAWIFAVCAGIKGLAYCYRRYVLIAGLPLPDQGVGSHEEAFFFCCFVGLLLAAWLVKMRGSLMVWLWLLYPAVVLGNLATNRRAGTAALVIALPILIMAAIRAMPKRRTMAIVLGVLMVTVGPVYYYTFRNSESTIAQPARAIKSHFEPNARDESSDLYRKAESANMMDTIKESPLTTLIGYGYGKPFLKNHPMADISKTYALWDVIPHNQILWVWMRTGTVGFIAFWMIIAFAIVRICRLMILSENDDSPWAQLLALWAFSIVVMAIVFGLLDLQLSCYRNMIFVGLVLGLVERSLQNRTRTTLVETATDAI